METKNIFSGNTNIPSSDLMGSNHISALGSILSGTSCGSSTSILNLYSNPILVDTIVLSDRIELVYKRTYMLSTGYNPCPEEVYKVIYSCVDGKWNISEPIFGKIIPASRESYEFEN